MTTALLERPGSLFESVIDPAVAQRALAASAVAQRRAAAEQAAAVGGRVTLEAAVFSAWEALSTHRTATCIVCDGHMHPRYGAQGRPVGGRCADCGSTLGLKQDGPPKRAAVPACRCFALDGRDVDGLRALVAGLGIERDLGSSASER